MAYNTAKMITDADGKLIPQMYDPVEDVYKPLTPDAYNNINVNSGTLSVDNFPARQDVQLMGSSIENQEIMLFNETAITTDGLISSGTIDVSMFNSFSIYARHDLNAELSFSYRADGFDTNYYNGVDWVLSYPGYEGSISIPNNSRWCDLNSFWQHLEGRKMNTIQLRFKAETVPTSGTVSVKIVGRG